MSKSVFDEFTNLYSLSKTLRFELRPVGKTLENMKYHLRYNPELQTFLADQEIEEAYQTLKPVLDFLHREFITESLESDTAKAVDFSEYLEKYRNRKEMQDKDFEVLEKPLRNVFGKAYEEAGLKLKAKAVENEKGKEIFPSKEGKSYKILTESGVLEYIKKNIDSFGDIRSADEIQKALDAFKGFFTYFGGFNQNRENYYETSKEAATAVATRIVHENLPKFCDNILFFENHAEEYKNAYQFLQSLGRNLVNKEKKPLFPIKEDLFQIKRFNQYLSQRGIETYNDQIANANFLINLYNQAKNKEESFKKLPFFKTVYKQIGCGKRNALFFTITHDKKIDADKARESEKEANSVEEVLELASKAGEKYFATSSDDGMVNTLPELLDYLKSQQDYSGFYWSKVAINTISDKYFANWHDCKDRLKKAKIFVKATKGAEEDIKIPEAVELEGLFGVLDETENWREAMFRTAITEDEKKGAIIQQSQNASQALLNLICADIELCANNFLQQSPGVLSLEKYDSKEAKEAIKTWMDNTLAITRMLKYFLVKPNKIKGSPLDSTLTQALDEILRGKDVDWFDWYDGLRNYLTKKPQDDVKKNKLKLNFKNSTLAGGWDINKEADNYCAIFQNSEGRQFLGIIAKQSKQKGFNKVFERNGDNPLYKINDAEIWDKMEYKLLPGPNKMLPKCLLPKSNLKKYGASDEILEIYSRGSFKKSEDSFSTHDLHQLIDFYKSALKKYEDWQCFEFNFRPTSEYADISQFYSEVERKGYKLDFVSVNKSELDQLVESGKIYLFEIKNQDSNQNKKRGHKDNLHTIYWRALFQEIANRPKLNGEAEIFYRKALPLDKMEKIKDKNNKEVIKNFRFSKEKFLFHVPITLNFCLKNERVNDLVKQKLSKDENIHFLGIDRGEKHLAYYSLLDKNGKMVAQGSFNEINGHNYHDKLSELEKNRMEARKNWQTIGTIKELKAGYISQVVKKIADLALEHNAFIVLEDLNTGFKRGRQKIEKSVYQKFELALAKKLNFLVNKTARNGEIGSVTNALQLTPPVNNYGDIEKRKQVGIMLYTRANYTSQTDPVTGWRKSIYLQKGSEENVKEQIVKVFKDIDSDGGDYCFTYFDENIVNPKTGEVKEWKMYSGKNGKDLDRFRGRRGMDKNEWTVEKQNIMEILDGVFENFDKNRSLLSQIVDEGRELSKVDGHSAWESLRFAIELIQQIRNTGKTEEDNDFLLSPVRDEHGNHFDSRKAGEGLPDSGDANGAYNIARKGLIMNEHIKRGYTLFIADAEWDAWLVGKVIWEKWLKENESELKSKMKG